MNFSWNPGGGGRTLHRTHAQFCHIWITNNGGPPLALQKHVWWLAIAENLVGKTGSYWNTDSNLKLKDLRQFLNKFDQNKVSQILDQAYHPPKTKSISDQNDWPAFYNFPSMRFWGYIGIRDPNRHDIKFWVLVWISNAMLGFYRFLEGFSLFEGQKWALCGKIRRFRTKMTSWFFTAFCKTILGFKI